MVFFSCDGCGEMLKKNQVDGHANRCRRCESVSCVDCSVSFFGDDYRKHTSCISEAERYEGALYKKNAKKRNPQQEWMDLVEECSGRAPAHLKGYMTTISGLDNVPRKEKQFRNFTANSLNLRGKSESIVGEIWKILKAERDKRQAAREAEMKQAKEAQEERKRKDAEEAEKSKEIKSSEGQSTTTDESHRIDSKKVHKAMKKALKKAPNKSMKLKELRKVLGDRLGLPKSAKKQLKQLLKDLPQASKSKMKLNGKVVSLE